MTGIVLAGGRSARLGTDKALLRLGDETLLERAVSALRPPCRKIIVVSDPRSPVPDVEGCTMATDEQPGLALSGDDWHLARAALASGKRALAAMLDRVQAKVLEADPELVLFTDVNTWEDYQAILCTEEDDAR